MAQGIDQGVDLDHLDVAPEEETTEIETETDEVAKTTSTVNTSKKQSYSVQQNSAVEPMFHLLTLVQSNSPTLQCSRTMDIVVTSLKWG